MKLLQSLGSRLLAGAILAVATGCQTQPMGTGSHFGLTAGADRQVAGLGAGVVAPLCSVAPVGSLLCPPTPTPTPTLAPCATQPYAIFAHSDDFALKLAGAGTQVEGPIHTNDCTWMVGLDQTILGRDEAARGFLVLGHNNDAGQRVCLPGVMDYPAPQVSVDAFGTPTYSFNGTVDLALVPGVWAGPGKLKPGVYRSTGAILLTAANVTGSVTLVAHGVVIAGSNVSLTAYSQGVVAWVDGCLGKDILIAGNDCQLNGNLLAYKGECLVAGDRNVVTGSIQCQTFDTAGLCNRFVAPPAGGECQASPTPLPTPSASPSPTVTPSGNGSTPPSPTPTPVATPSVGGTPAPTPTPSPAGSPTPVPTATPSPGSTWTIASGGFPFAIAIDSSQNVWYTNPSGNTAVATELDNSGNVLGQADDGWNARSLAVQPGTNLVWIANHDAGNISVINPDRSVDFVTTPGGQLDGIAFDAGGTPWVTDSQDNQVFQLDPGSGAVVHTFPVGLAPRGIVADARGNIWVANHGESSVTELSPTGATLGTYAVGQYPGQLAIDPQGNVWVTNQGQDIPYPSGTVPGSTVTELSPTGTALGTFTVGNSPYGIAFDLNGNALVVNTGDNTVNKLSPNGQVLATYPVGQQPYGVAVDRSGYAWIANYVDGTVTRLFP